MIVKVAFRLLKSSFLELSSAWEGGSKNCQNQKNILISDSAHQKLYGGIRKKPWSVTLSEEPRLNDKLHKSPTYFHT